MKIRMKTSNKVLLSGYLFVVAAILAGLIYIRTSGILTEAFLSF